MKKSIVLATVLAMSLSLSSAFISLAGQWQQNATGWWYQEDNNTYPVNSWKELDGKWYYFNQDGYMVSNAWVGNYYLGSDGVMLTNTTTPDGYKVGTDGAWIQNKNPMAGIECSSKWLMEVNYSIEDLGDKYKIIGDVYDYQVVMNYLDEVGSDDWLRENNPELYYSLDNGFRKSNVTIYVDKDIPVSYYPLSEEVENYRASNLTELFYRQSYTNRFAFDLNGDSVIVIYDVLLNYVG